jgi:hypothetical protein
VRYDCARASRAGFAAVVILTWPRHRRNTAIFSIVNGVLVRHCRIRGPRN